MVLTLQTVSVALDKQYLLNSNNSIDLKILKKNLISNSLQNFAQVPQI
jgi:hypothetical protein